jgi:hypothetical protein
LRSADCEKVESSDQSAGSKMPASLLIALIDVPVFRTIVDSSSPVSLRRFRMIFTWTRSLKSRELRKYVGLRRFISVSDGCWWGHGKADVTPLRPGPGLSRSRLDAVSENATGPRASRFRACV